ncbi:enoyl-CoA hydratase [Promicromonospora citrea]|uniref:Enoyl-CoA hydratase n=1 Tax=Promicromonospora citrea TaxID=43677 RepID=A0A8H9L3R0_9MICO|nr:enoyl-CoA hydratase [Promicromonospora citrea]NNH51380.1 enoyl-CoA hydratase [Promicromonospora citrea]GGM22875.1 enoyl-CoA hydratase [Promicromonospora citrea]
MTDSSAHQSVRLGDRVTYDVPLPRVARATLTRAENGNLQDVHLFYQLDAAYRRAGADDSISVLVLAADGDDFSLGHDVEALFSTDGMEQVTLEGGFSRGGVEGDMAWETEVFLELHWRWRNFPKPVVAAVQGRVFAGGMMTMWPADLIVASEDATFADPVTAFGIGHVELFLHPWELGARKAKELLFTGETMTAAEAKDGGMVSRVVPRAELVAETLALAERIAARPSHGLRMAKKSVNQTLDIQGQWNAVQAAFSIHTLGHAHSRVAHDGAYIDPAGFALTRDIWGLADTDV